MSKVCVIIPAYNAEKYLAETVESVKAQTFSDWTIIIVDDGSKDRTASIADGLAAADMRIKFVRQENAGISATRNRGAALTDSDTDYILFLDADDLLNPTALARLVDVLTNAPEAVGSYGMPQFFGNDQLPNPIDISKSFGFNRKKIQAGRMVNVPDEEDTGFASLVIWPCIATPGQLLIRRSSFFESGAFDETAPPGEDWDHWIRLSMSGNFKMIREFVLRKRNHSTNVSGSGKRFAQSEIWTRRKYVSMASLNREQREVARKGHLYSCVIKCGWAYDHLKHGRFVEALKSYYRAGRSYVQWAMMWR